MSNHVYVQSWVVTTADDEGTTMTVTAKLSNGLTISNQVDITDIDDYDFVKAQAMRALKPIYDLVGESKRLRSQVHELLPFAKHGIFQSITTLNVKHDKCDEALAIYDKIENGEFGNVPE